MLKPLVINKSPQNENSHFPAFRTQILSCIVPRQALKIGTCYQQIRSRLLQPVYRLSQVTGSPDHISFALQCLRKNGSYNWFGDQEQDRRLYQGVVRHGRRFRQLHYEPVFRSVNGRHHAAQPPNPWGGSNYRPYRDSQLFPTSPAGPEGQSLRIMDLETQEVTTLTTDYDNFPLWSPRGDLIAFVRL